VNGYFLCDRGRYGYEYINSKSRIRKPRIPGEQGKATKAAGINELLGELKNVLQGKDSLTGIGSARASLESNYALKKLVGEANFFTGMSDIEHDLAARGSEILRHSPAQKYSLKNIEKSECVLILGEDLTNTAPMMALAVRQAARQKPIKQAGKLKIREWDDKAVREAIQTDKGPVFTITPGPTKLDEISTKSIRMAPVEIAGLGYAIAHYLDDSSPLPANQTKDVRDLAKDIAGVLAEAEDVSIISGTSCLDENVMNAASNIASARAGKNKKTGICLTFPEANTLGLTLLGGRKLSELKDEKTAERTVIILENDLYKKLPEKEAGELLDSFKYIVVADSLENNTTQKAGYILPAAVITESDGHLVNNEGRVQRFHPVQEPDITIQPGWRWMQALAGVTGNSELAGKEHLVAYAAAIEKDNDIFEGLNDLASHYDYRIGAQKIPRAPHRYSGRTAIHADKTIHEPKPPEDENSPMSFSMEGFHGHAPAPFNPWFWSPGWNSIQSLNKYQIETGGELHREFPDLCLFGKKNGRVKKQEYYKPSGTDKAVTGEWTFLPLYHIYGSEELSIKEGGLRELMVTPYVALNPEDAKKNKWDESTKINLQVDGQALIVPVKIQKGIPAGRAGIPVGTEGIPSSGFTFGLKITKIK